MFDIKCNICSRKLDSADVCDAVIICSRCKLESIFDPPLANYLLIFGLCVYTSVLIFLKFDRNVEIYGILAPYFFIGVIHLAKIIYVVVRKVRTILLKHFNKSDVKHYIEDETSEKD